MLVSPSALAAGFLAGGVGLKHLWGPGAAIGGWLHGLQYRLSHNWDHGLDCLVDRSLHADGISQHDLQLALHFLAGHVAPLQFEAVISALGVGRESAGERAALHAAALDKLAVCSTNASRCRLENSELSM